ncbi:hypothetical protein ABLN87_19545 [Ruegeria sp. SCPT10]|uniref:hypothetical protein n=1 Tax=Ruegeria sp. SCP10 TaxID=3141377 RepID=UPI00333A8BFA
MSGADEMTWALLEGLELVIDDCENVLWATSSQVCQKSSKGGYPIHLIAALFFELKPDLDAQIHDLVEQYHEYWVRGDRQVSLKAINLYRRSLLGSSEDLNDVLMGMQFLTGDVPWSTAQDGILFYICVDLRKAGISVARLKQALRLSINEST